MNPPIAFIGHTGAGKTTCASILIEQFGYDSTTALDSVVDPDAAWMLKGEGYTVVRLVAPTVMRRDRLNRAGRYPEELFDANELDYVDADHRIINDRWTDDLEHALQRIINEERS